MMIDNELKKIWMNAHQNEIVKFEKSKLLINMDNRVSTLKKLIEYRNIAETVAAIAVILFFTYYAYILPNAFSKAGAVFISLWALFVIFKLRSTNRSRHNEKLTLPLYQMLTQSKEYIEKEMQLVNSVLYWYIIPPFIGSVLFLIGLNMNMLAITIKLAFIVLLSIIVYVLNKRAVKKQFKPVLANLESAIEELNTEA
jgi:ABC-type multidrug transport system fused ATPase/permease subunit